MVIRKGQFYRDNDSDDWGFMVIGEPRQDVYQTLFEVMYTDGTTTEMIDSTAAAYYYLAVEAERKEV